MPHRLFPQFTEPYAVDSSTAAEFVGLKPPTLDKDRRTGHLGIPYVKAGRRVLYSLEDLDAWLEGHTQRPEPNGVCHENK